jgi:ribosomal protein S18 acetylase RimI-like enzyme
MKPKYNQQISRLLIYGFRGKFHPLTNLTDTELALFFEKLLDYFPNEPASQRMVALQSEEVVGSLSIKWNATPNTKQEAQKIPWHLFKLFGKWNSVKLFLALYFLNHQPQDREYYIADVSVHPAHRGKGIGKQLLQWAKQSVQADPYLDTLSLHVSDKNLRAKKLYEQLSFQTQEQKSSFTRYLLFNEFKWHYMVQKLN